MKPAWFGLPDAGVATRLSFLFAAVWWAVSRSRSSAASPSRPRRTPPDERAGQGLVKIAVARLGETLRDMRRTSRRFLFLLAFLIYNDGIGTIIRMAPIYGTEIGHRHEAPDRGAPAGAVRRHPVLVPFGAIAGRIGAKRAIFISLAVYLVITCSATS